MNPLFRAALRRVVQRGSLRVTCPDGSSQVFGDGTGRPVHFRLTDPAWAWKILLDPDLRLGEAYMEGALVMEEGDIHDLLVLLIDNARHNRLPAPLSVPGLWRLMKKRLQQFNPRGRSRRNVAHHYDLDGRLYDLFLDHDRQYSCAYFEPGCSSLHEAQLAKKRHLAAKLRIRPGMRVLDIGCGWGGLALYLAEICEARVVGITLSEEQYEIARQRARQRGLEDRVEFRLQDYRDVNETFDRIVSVGMFEHVGVGHYPAFFRKVRELLAPDGVAVLHSINRSDGPGYTSAWIDRYIFPGGYIPALSEVVPVIERERLIISDIEILRLHYAETLRHWRERFCSQWDKAKALYDERFCRMWEFYLAASEAMFRTGLMNNFQIQMVRDQSALPMTRNYMWEEEERLRRIDSQRRHLASVPAE
jgi:cyclopropane-fatty-acyl-phospholipid synthase